jgi:hypothetical protein
VAGLLISCAASISAVRACLRQMIFPSERLMAISSSLDFSLWDYGSGMRMLRIF